MGRPRKRSLERRRASGEEAETAMNDRPNIQEQTTSEDPDSITDHTDMPTAQHYDVSGKINTTIEENNSHDTWDIPRSMNSNGHLPVSTAPPMMTSIQGASQHTMSSQPDFGLLPSLYSMLISFQSLPPPSFPSSRGPLLKATDLARATVRCPLCPMTYSSALQNLMLLTTLLLLVADGYANLLKSVKEQAAEGKMITYRVGDASLSSLHLHTGSFDCPMGFNVDLTAEEWVIMAKKVLKQDLYGASQSIDCLVGVVEELEQRQHIWHLLQPFDTNCTNAGCPVQQSQDSHGHGSLCLSLVRQIRKAIEALEL
ncbi:MAG: hypothetical protein Q9220_007268 [cf. Caloplaca sp. 1 TL-2023]